MFGTLFKILRQLATKPRLEEEPEHFKICNCDDFSQIMKEDEKCKLELTKVKTHYFNAYTQLGII